METDPNESASFRMMMELMDRNILQSTFAMPMVEVFAWDLETLKIVALNEKALAATGLTLRRGTQLKITDLWPGLTENRITLAMNRLRKKPSHQLAFRVLHKDIDGFPRQSRVVLHYIDEARASLVAFIQNITPHYDARANAATVQDMFSTAIESLPDGFVLYDANDQLVICNENYRNIYKQSAPIMQKGKTFREILQFGLDKGEYAAAIGREAEWLAERLSAHRAANVTVEQQLTSGQWLRIVERRTPDGGRVGLRIDITEHKENEAKLERYACTDHLTGLMNRRGLMERLADLSNTLSADEKIAVLHIDLDKFKTINDTQGHDAGDFVLKHAAEILCEAVDNVDAVARVGGDEFIVFLQTEGDSDDIVAKSKEIISLISAPTSFRRRQCSIGASIGIAIFSPQNEASIGDALTGADIALNVAKQAGRGQCRIYEKSMRDGAIKLVQLSLEIKEGLAKGEFEPFFQPQVNALTGDIVGFEALIRWRHPQRGLISAFEFLPAAESAGLMQDIDDVVLENSCAAAATISSWGLPHAAVSINMSTALLQDREIVTRLLATCERHKIQPKNLRLELLEYTLLEERSEMIVRNVHKLIGAGFAIELDDFGTGHAAIVTLRKFSVARIKIDRSLVKDIDSDPELRVITGAIINLADRLGISVLAEGVETADEQATLNAMGCALSQGYFHGRPMPIDDLRNWILNHTAVMAGAGYRQTPVEGLAR